MIFKKFLTASKFQKRSGLVLQYIPVGLRGEGVSKDFCVKEKMRNKKITTKNSIPRYASSKQHRSYYFKIRI